MMQFQRALFLFALVAYLAHPCDAQMFGVPSPTATDSQWDQVTSMLPEKEPMVFAVWNKAAAPNPDGNPSDQWYADEKIQTSLGKLKSAIGGLENQIPSPVVARIVADIGWKLVKQPGFVSVDFDQIGDDFDPNDFRVGVVSRLDEHEEEVSAWVDELGEELEFELTTEEGANVWTNLDGEIKLGVTGGCLMFAINDEMWDQLKSKVDGSGKAPGWLQEKADEMPMPRRSFLLSARLKKMLDALPMDDAPDDAKEMLSRLKLDEMKSISLASGADGFSNLSVTRFETGFEGLMSVMDVTPFDESDFFPMPSDSGGALAIKFRPDNLAGLIKQFAPEQFDQARSQMVEEFGIDFEADLANSLDGSIRYYARGGMLTPRIIGIMGVKDRDGFPGTIGKIKEAIATRAFGFGGEFYEKKSKSGVEVFGVNGGPMLSVFMAYHEGELYLSNNKRAIPSFIKKIGKYEKSSSVLSGELMQKVLADAKATGLTGPIGLQYTDMDQMVETVFPVLSMVAPMLPRDYRDYFDFGLEDLPPVESLLGLRPSANIGFRSEDGIVLLSRYDTPIATEVSTIGGAGVMIGMLLPAVQQVRAAARRTASMNNLRQLMLASLNYEAKNRHLPAAYSVAEDGTPLLSWRVHILPYLDQQELYDQFHLDEPWDSEHNIKLLEKMPVVFQNPASLPMPGKTMYVVPSGEDMAFGTGGAHGFGEITDGSSNTIAIFEGGSDNAVPWTAPQDMDVSLLESMDLNTGHVGVFNVVFVDGSVRAMSMMTSVDDFRDMCTINDGKLVAP